MILSFITEPLKNLFSAFRTNKTKITNRPRNSLIPNRAIASKMATTDNQIFNGVSVTDLQKIINLIENKQANLAESVKATVTAMLDFKTNDGLTAATELKAEGVDTNVLNTVRKIFSKNKISFLDLRPLLKEATMANLNKVINYYARKLNLGETGLQAV